MSAFGREEKTISQSDSRTMHAMMTLLYRTLQSTLVYDRVMWRTWLIAKSNKFALKIAAKLLQIKTWLLLAV